MSHILDVSSTYVAARPASFREELAAIGIPIVPARLLEEHKARLMRGRSPLLRMIWHVLSTVSLVKPLRYLERQTLLMIPLAFMCSVSISVLAIAASFLGGHYVYFLTVPIAFSGCVLFATVPALASLSAGWARARISAAGEMAFVDQSSVSMPIILQPRARQALSLPGTRLIVEFIDEDPFLYVVRGWGPFAESIPIAAWRTGNQRLDSI